MSEKAICPRCERTQTEWVAEVNTQTGELKRFKALCDRCQADKAELKAGV